MTALQPPILNLNRLRISSGWPRDFRMSMLLQTFSCYSDKLMWGPAELISINGRWSSSSSSPGRGVGFQSQASSDRLTRPIGWRVMGLARRLQWASRASGVMPRLSVLSSERGFWLVSGLSERETIPSHFKLCKPERGTCWLCFTLQLTQFMLSKVWKLLFFKLHLFF